MTREECIKKLQQRPKDARDKQKEDYSYYRGLEDGLLKALELIGMVKNTDLDDKVDNAKRDIAYEVHVMIVENKSISEIDNYVCEICEF